MYDLPNEGLPPITIDMIEMLPLLTSLIDFFTLTGLRRLDKFDYDPKY